MEIRAKLELGQTIVCDGTQFIAPYTGEFEIIRDEDSGALWVCRIKRETIDTDSEQLFPLTSP